MYIFNGTYIKKLNFIIFKFVKSAYCNFDVWTLLFIYCNYKKFVDCEFTYSFANRLPHKGIKVNPDIFIYFLNDNSLYAYKYDQSLF